MSKDVIGIGSNGQPVYLKDIWPTQAEVQEAVATGLKPEMFTKQYSDIVNANPQWKEIETTEGTLYEFKDASTYIQNPPFFDGFGMEVGEIKEFRGMRAMGIFGDSVTTDHISPAGAILENGPAGRFLKASGVDKKDFNSFGSRRGNDRIMTRGTFANVRIKNKMAEGKEGGYTKKDGKIVDIFDACEEYKEAGIPLIVFGGLDYGMGSSRDWAAKGTNLLGVKAVVVKSFERIHRSNLLGMGVLPLQFKEGEDAETLGLDGTETFNLVGFDDTLQPGAEVTLEIERADGSKSSTQLITRVDTGIEVDYYRHGGILPYVLRNILKDA